MGGCFSAGEEGAKRRDFVSTLSNLNDSRHVMMRRSWMKGATIQKDGSFYRPREDTITVGVPHTVEGKEVITSTLIENSAHANSQGLDISTSP